MKSGQDPGVQDSPPSPGMSHTKGVAPLGSSPRAPSQRLGHNLGSGEGKEAARLRPTLPLGAEKGVRPPNRVTSPQEVARGTPGDQGAPRGRRRRRRRIRATQGAGRRRQQETTQLPGQGWALPAAPHRSTRLGPSQGPQGFRFPPPGILIFRQLEGIYQFGNPQLCEFG